MSFKHLPVLFVGSILILLGAWKLLGESATSPAGAGALLGAGLVVIAAWIWQEFDNRS